MKNDLITQQLSNFFSTYQTFHFSADEILIRKGETPYFLYFLESGLIKQSTTTSNGQEIIITFFKPGAFLPLVGAVENKAVSYDFRAVKDSSGHKAPKSAVIRFLQKNADVSFGLTQRLLSALEGVSRKLEFALQASAELRIAEVLLTLAYRFGHGKEDNVKLILTHQELSELTGLSRETVTRELKSLRAKELISNGEKGTLFLSIKEIEKYLGIKK